MGNGLLMGLDVGTSSCKAMVFDHKGGILGYAYAEYAILCDDTGKMEQDSVHVLNCLLSCMTQAAAQCDAGRIEAISISVQGDAAIPVDSEHRPLHNAMLGMDYRPGRQCDAIRARMDAWKIYEITGQPLHPINFAAKILWFKDNVPDIYEWACKFVTYAEFVMANLGGRPDIDVTMASRSMAMDIHSGRWSAALLDELGLDIDKLSDITECGVDLGKLAPRVAQATGINPGARLIAGGHDQPVGAIGAGAVSEGMAVDSSGTAEIFSMVYSKPRISRAMHDAYLSTYRHAARDMYFSFAFMQAGGILLKWYRDTMGYRDVVEAQQRGMDMYSYIQRDMDDSPSPLFVLPHFNGSGTPLCDLKSHGAIVGLGLETTRYDIFKALMEGLTYELRLNIDAAESAGIAVNEIRATGGGAKSEVWLRTKANITGRTLTTLKCKEAGCLGAAVIAAAGTGVYPGLKQAVEGMVKTDRVFAPNQQKTAMYEDRYSLYKQLYYALRDINHAL